MVPRGWSVVVLLATVLVVYLVMPDLSASSRGAVARAAAAVSGTVRDDSGQPVLTSDDVTVQPRGTSAGRPSSPDRDFMGPPPDAVPLALPSSDRHADDRVRVALRPVLSVLQVLRC